MLIYEIIEAETKPVLRLDFRFLLWGAVILISFLTSGGDNGTLLGEYDWILGILALLLIIASVFAYFFEARLFKTIGTIGLREESFIIKKGTYAKTYVFADIQEIRYGRQHKKERYYKVEFDDILLYLKLDEEQQKEFEAFLEQNVLNELEVEGALEPIKLK